MISFCTQTACKDTAFFRIVQVFYAICPIFLLSYRDDIGEERLPCAGTTHCMGRRNRRTREYMKHSGFHTRYVSIIYPLLRRSYRICFSFYSKQKTVSGANRTSRERNEHLIMGERKINKNKNHAKMDFLHFFCKKFVYVKKKQYLCTRNQ